MDLSAVRARRRKSLFRPWNSFLAKKNASDTVILAQKYDHHRREAEEGHVPHFSPLVRLTVKLIDTYESINAAYYGHRESNEAEIAAAAAANLTDYQDASHPSHYSYQQPNLLGASQYTGPYPTDQQVHDHHDQYYISENQHEPHLYEHDVPFDLRSHPQHMQRDPYQQDEYAQYMPTVPHPPHLQDESPMLHHSIGSHQLQTQQHYLPHDSQNLPQQAYAHQPAPSSHMGSTNQQTGPPPPTATAASLSNAALQTTTAVTNTENATTSPHSIQYHDEKFDYIVRPGEIFNNRYNVEKVIGRGSFGQVVRALDTRSSTHVAIKIIKNNSSYVEHALSEVRMTSYLNSIDPEDEHSIMRLRDKFIYRGHQCLVLELLAHSLYDLLVSTGFLGVSLKLVRKFCTQILRCLVFLAQPNINIAHCDLKPENVLLRHPQRSIIKVVDFGAAAHISDSMRVYVQSRFYRAPEVILGLPYSTQVDIWSLGCMLVELLTGRPVFAGRDEKDQMAIIVERLGIPPAHMLERGEKTYLFFEQDMDQNPPQWRLRPSIIEEYGREEPGSKPVRAFIDYCSNGRRKRSSGGNTEDDYDVFLKLTYQMLDYDPEKRITAAQAMNDAFVCGPSTRSGSASGRESPPPMPNGISSVNKPSANVPVDPGRKAPHTRRRAVAAAISSNGTVNVSTAGPSSSLGGPATVASVSKTLSEVSLNPKTNGPSTTETETLQESSSISATKPVASRSVVGAPSTASTLNTATSLSDIVLQVNFVSNSEATNPSSLTATGLSTEDRATAAGSRNDVAFVISNSDSEPMTGSVVDTTAATSTRSSRRVMIDPGCNSDGGAGDRDRHGDRINSHEPSREGNMSDVGGRLRASKSEPAIESLVPKRTFVFTRSDWAEGLGIEPPPWRSGGSLDTDVDPASPRCGAGSGAQLLQRRPRTNKKVGNGSGFGGGGGCSDLLLRRNYPDRQRISYRYDRLHSGRWHMRNASSLASNTSVVSSQTVPEFGRTATVHDLSRPDLPLGHGDALRPRFG